MLCHPLALSTDLNLPNSVARGIAKIVQAQPGRPQRKVNAYFNCIQDYVTEVCGNMHGNEGASLPCCNRFILPSLVQMLSALLSMISHPLGLMVFSCHAFSHPGHRRGAVMELAVF